MFWSEVPMECVVQGIIETQVTKCVWYLVNILYDLSMHIIFYENNTCNHAFLLSNQPSDLLKNKKFSLSRVREVYFHQYIYNLFYSVVLKKKKLFKRKIVHVSLMGVYFAACWSPWDSSSRPMWCPKGKLKDTWIMPKKRAQPRLVIHLTCLPIHSNHESKLIS